MFFQHSDLFEFAARPIPVETAKAWQPRSLAKEQWSSRDYAGVYQWRLQQLNAMRKDANVLKGALEYYKTHRAEFIMHWVDTYDPRDEKMKWRPFVFFKRQTEFIEFLDACYYDKQSGLTEKCRDIGATWLACAWSVHAWLFEDNVAVGWGSRKEDLVDEIGNSSSIFEKIRLIIRRLPTEFLPNGLNAKTHLTYMKCINPANGATIVGETGDNIGRGGRTSIYFKDESAHYPRPELIEAALGDNTNVQIDISSVNGLGNVFHRRREAGVDWPLKEPNKTRVFVFDWSDHPEKTTRWYAARKAKDEADGLLHVFAQEVDRNYSAAVENTIIAGEWIKAAIDAEKYIPWIDDRGFMVIGLPPEMLGEQWGAALDVADGGGDTNALAARKGIVLKSIDEWGAPDPGVTARRAIDYCKPLAPIFVQYDSIGVGATVKAEFNRLTDDSEGTPILDARNVTMIPWNAGAGVIDPFFHVVENDDESPLNRDFFANLKAQAWWSLRLRFWRTFQAVVNGVIYDPATLIVLSRDMPLLRKLEKELAQPTRGQSSQNLKMVVNKKPDGTKSPNLADAVMMAYFPLGEFYAKAIYGTYGNVD